MIRILQLLFCPSKFVDAEVEHIKKLNESGKVYGDPEKYRNTTIDRVAKKRKGQFISFILVLGVVVLGYFVAWILNHNCSFSLTSIRIIRALSIIIVAWGVLGRIGYESPTMGGETLLEITSELSFKQIYCFGIFIVSTALFLETNNI